MVTAQYQARTTPLSILRERWRAAFVCGVLVAGIGLAFGFTRPPVYEAKSTVVLSPVSSVGTARSPIQDINTTTESEIAQSLDVAAAVKAQLPSDPRSAEDLATGLEMAAPAGGEVLEFTYRSDSADDAIELSNLFAEQYLVRRNSNAQSTSETLYKALEERIAATRGNSSSSQALRETLRAQQRQLPMVYDLGYVASPATQAELSSSARKSIFIAAALLAGVLAAVLGALAVDRLDPRVLNQRRLREVVPSPVVVAARGTEQEAGERCVIILKAASHRAAVTSVAAISTGTTHGQWAVAAIAAALASDEANPMGISRGASIEWRDARGVATLSARLNAARFAAAAVLVVDRADRLSAVAELIDALEQSGGKIDVTVLVDEREGRRA